MNISQFGNGKETIIFIHGLAGSHNVFKHEIEYFSKEYNVIAYDYIGHGENTSEKEFNLNNLVDELYQLFNFNNIQKAHLCCLCFGGNIANIFAAKFPSMVKSICHIGGSIKGDNKYTRTFKSIWEYSLNNSIENTLEYYADKFYEGDPNANEQKEIMLKHARIMSPEVMMNAIDIRANYDMKSLLEQIDKPMLYIFGEHDELFLSCVHDIANTVNNSEIIVLQNASHVAHIFQPKLFLNAYSMFLKGLKYKKIAV